MLTWLTVSMILFPTAIAAQDGQLAPANAPPKGLCFGPGRLTDCRTILLTEVSINSQRFGDGGLFSWEIGGMVNIDGAQAVGATLAIGARDSRNGHWGVNARYRRFFENIGFVDLSPGIVVVGTDYDGKRLRLTADLSVGVPLGGVFTHFESNRDSGALGFGAKLGSWAGLVLGVLTYTAVQIVPYT